MGSKVSQHAGRHWNEALKTSTFTSPLATPEEIAAGMCASDGPLWMLQMNPWRSSWRGKICCCAPGLGGILQADTS